MRNWKRARQEEESEIGWDEREKEEGQKEAWKGIGKRIPRWIR